MTERMTDERLAEIEDRWIYDGWILDSDGFAIIEALKAERAKLAEREEGWREHVTGLHSQILTLEEERDDLCAALSGQTDRAVVAEAKLRAAGELPRFDVEYGGDEIGLYRVPTELGDYVDADELEALLKGGAG